MTALRPVTPPPEPEPAPPRAGIEADAQQIREWLFSPVHTTTGRLGSVVTRPFGIQAASRLGAVVTGLAGAALRFLVPVLAGLAAGDLTESPVGTWAVIAGVLGVLDVVTTLRSQNVEIQTAIFALLRTLERQSDADDMLLFTRRRWRLVLNATFGAGVSVLTLLVFALAAPSAFDALPVGSAAMLGVLAYELGEYGYLYVGFLPAFFARLARREHRLFWLSPLDSEPIRETLHAAGMAMSVVGLVITQTILLSVFLVSLESPLFLPVVATFTGIGYVAIAVTVVGMRRSVRTIAMGVRDRHLRVLEDRIDDFGSRLASLTPAENDELRHLVETYRAVREMPTSPSRSETFGHAAVALLIPTFGFLIAVLTEVYAERLLDQLLP